METKSFEKYVTRIKYGKFSWKMRTEKKVMNIGDYVSHDLGAHSVPRVMGAESQGHVVGSLHELPCRIV